MTEHTTTDQTETTAETAVEAPESVAAPEVAPEGQDSPQDAQEAAGGDSEEDGPETFPRKVVEDLRRENAKYRDRAKDRDDLAERLHLALVTATGRLADPTDLAFDAAHLDDAAAIEVAVDELLERKPHLASRRPAGDVGQGATGGGSDVDLAGMLRGLAG